VANQSAWKGKLKIGAVSKIASASPGVLDGGCVLDAGAFSAQYVDQKTLIRVVDGGESLFGFLALLIEDLKPLGTTPPWDLGLYSSTSRKLLRIEPPKEAAAEVKKAKLD